MICQLIKVRDIANRSQKNAEKVNEQKKHEKKHFLSLPMYGLTLNGLFYAQKKPVR
jgi:hypothetical protein